MKYNNIKSINHKIIYERNDKMNEEKINQELDQNTYDENSISVLEGLEAVRKRPGMYIGSTGKNGLHHLVYEIVDNCIDEAVNGSCDTINVTINKNNSVTVIDNGRGIPCGIHPKKKISTLEVVLSTLHAGGKFGQGGYKVAGGLHGVGSSVVNALSVEFEATVHREGKIYQQHYSKGKKLDEVTIIGKTDKSGTIITFLPDDTIFSTTTFEYGTLAKRLKELAFLNKKITITFEDKRIGKEQIQTFHYEGGIKEFVEYINENKDAIHDTIYIEKDVDDCHVEIAFQYTNNYNENLYSFVNNINTIEGGYHVNGFYNGLVKVLNQFAKDNKYLKEKDENFQREDIKEGITVIVSIKIPEPEFEGQTKTKLGNTYIQSIIVNIIKEYMEVYSIENIQATEQITNKVLESHNSRIASKKAKELTRKKSGSSNFQIPPNKVALCTLKNPKKCEFIVVEGDSAGGSAKQARDRRFQTIMSSKGKIMNVEKQKEEKVFNSEELRIFSTAIGTGMGEDFDIEKLLYNFILIMHDADSDGNHIGALWITYIYRYMKPIITNGHLYFCVSPLYRNTINKKYFYTYSEEDQQIFINEHKNDNITETQRYKGLGEMNPDQLWDTTLNPEKRTLQQVTIEDAIEAEQTITLLMGDKVPPRKDFIKNNSKLITNLDV